MTWPTGRPIHSQAVVRLVLTVILALSALLGAAFAFGVRSVEPSVVAVSGDGMEIVVAAEDQGPAPCAPAGERQDDADPSDDADDDDVDDSASVGSFAARFFADRGEPLARPTAHAPPRQIAPSVDVPPPRRA